jgi:endogenous inhibitor of DNA gyrase (YacG/DUF329 family)
MVQVLFLCAREGEVMNDVQRKRIFDLRAEGVGYKAIGHEIGISEDSVKKFCKRYHLTGPKEVVVLNQEVLEDNKRICPFCKKPLRKKHKGRPRRFCSGVCRKNWWNAQKERGTEEALYTFTCAHCDTEFKSYGNKHRKYCSHSCFIKSRFGEVEDDGV